MSSTERHVTEPMTDTVPRDRVCDRQLNVTDTVPCDRQLHVTDTVTVTESVTDTVPCDRVCDRHSAM